MKTISWIRFIGTFFVCSIILLHWQPALRAQTAPPDSIVQATADAQGLTQITRDGLPKYGTYWLVLAGAGGAIAAPMPCPPSDTSLPIYQVADGQFIVDATTGRTGLTVRQVPTQAAIAGALEAQANAVVSLITQIQASALRQQMRTMMGAMGMNAPMPGDGIDWGGSGSATNFFIASTFDTNLLWLEITNVAGGWTYLNLHNATNQVYAIWGTTNLLAGWEVQTELWPTDTNCQPFAIATLDRQNLFLRAQDWTDFDSNADGIPDWWEWNYFGQINIATTNQDYSGSGLTFADDYATTNAPTVFQFSAVEFAQNHVSYSPVPAQLTVSGYPYYIATLIDDTNFADAVWQNYTGPAISLNLGTTEGWHDVWIGLRGHAEDASIAVWQWNRVKLDYTPPALVITGPTNPAQIPVIQLTGFSPEALAAINYDLSNATGTVTNQSVFITDQVYSPKTAEFATNYFQGFDIPLTNGVNTFTLHATDLAGNVSTLATNITLNYAGKTAPTVTLQWPQPGMTVCGDTFLWNGLVSDPTAAVTAQCVDGDGNTNTFIGTVGRDGQFWIHNLPLHSGTNDFTLSVVDVMQNATMTNLTVSQGTSGLSVDTIPANQTTVTGHIDSTDYSVWVNGKLATISGTTWEADNVPMPPNASLVKISAVPNSGTSPSDNLSTPITNSGIYLESYSDSFHDHYDFYTNGVICETFDYEFTMNYGNRTGGTNILHWKDLDGSDEFDTNIWPAAPWPNSMPDGLTFDNWDGGYIATHNAFMGSQHCNADLNDQYSYTTSNDVAGKVVMLTKEGFHETGEAKLTLATGGAEGSTAANLWMISVNATSRTFIPSSDGIEDPPRGLPNGSIPYNKIKVGIFGSLDTNGCAYKVLPDSTNVDVTVSVDGTNYFTYNMTPNIVKLESLTVVSNSAVQVGGTNNWAAVKTPTNDWVYVKAKLSTDYTNAATLIHWSPANLESVPGDPFQRRVTKTVSEKIPVIASLGSTNKSLTVWILWGAVTIITNGTTPANAVEFAGMYDGTENLGGQIVGNDAVGKVVPIAHLTPTGVGAIVNNGWAFKREMWSHTFLDGIPGNIWNTSWVPDDSESWVQNLIPDDQDKIYDRDAPNIDHFSSPNNPVEYSCVEINKNFHQWIEWNGIQASDGIQGTDSFPEGAKWHWKAKRQSSANPQPILKDASGGNITLPSSASGCP